MTDGICKICPDGKLCVGRSSVVNRVISNAFTDRATLLFGGRQAGKTNLLRFIANQVREPNACVSKLGNFDAAVYIDLMALDYQAGPADFFRSLTRQLKKVCEIRIEGFSLAELPSDNGNARPSLDLFYSDITTIFQACGEVELRALFLLDESHRVLGTRFPRGFQDNLFALLYGTEFADAERVAMVFAGGRDLYAFCEDVTSPIGSRAAMEFIKNLTPADVLKLLKEFFPNGVRLEEMAEGIWSRTGGQVGLTARFVEQVVTMTRGSRNVDTQEISERLKSRHAELFKLWVLSFGEEERCVHESLLSKSRLRLEEIAGILHRANCDQYIARTVCDVLEFSGIARVENRELFRVNELYWETIGEFHVAQPHEKMARGPSQGAAGVARDTWDQIMRLELTMRSFILSVFKSQWPGREVEQMRQILGEQKWAHVQAKKLRALKQYRFSPDRTERSEMECMYLSDLTDLIVSNKAWQYFRVSFRDKRQLQDLIAAISPVRNDCAHFVTVPDKELNRCRIACDDLTVIIDQAARNCDS